MNGSFDVRAAMKGAHWEQAKGHMRALVAIDGSQSSAETERPYRFERVSKILEAFIKEFESEGWHE